MYESLKKNWKEESIRINETSWLENSRDKPLDLLTKSKPARYLLSIVCISSSIRSSTNCIRENWKISRVLDRISRMEFASKLSFPECERKKETRED